MKRNYRVIFVYALFVLSILGCNFPSAQPTISVNDEAATIIAATLQAQAENGGDVPITATFSLVSQITSTVGASATITPTFSTPILTVQESTNCRTGPGQDYEIVFTYLKGKQLEILGNYPQENYWLVRSVESPGGQCWLWGEYVDVSGSYWAVSSVTPPPTATQSLPQAPAVEWEFNCDYNANQMDVSFTWVDYATNETSYRVIRNDERITELPANTTAYRDVYTFDTAERVLYQIEAYNSTGSARSTVISITC